MTRETMGSSRIAGYVAAIIAGLLLAGGALLMSGCGAADVVDKVDSVVDKALGRDQGSTGSGDTGDGSTTTATPGGAEPEDGTSSTSGVAGGESGDPQIEVGEGAALPDGFPASLIPPGAEIKSTMTMEQDATVIKSVSFAAAGTLDDVYRWFVTAVPEAGFEIEHKMQFDTGNGKGFTVMGKKGGIDLVATGAGEGEDIIYTVALTER